LTGYPRLTIPYGRGWITINEQGEALERFVWHYGLHEPEVWKALSALAEKDEVFWDIGANIGTVAIQALLDERVKYVHCFEPNPQIIQILEYNLHLNSNIFQVHSLALSDKISEVDFYFGGRKQSDISSLKTNRGFGMLKIITTTIDERIKLGIPAPTLIKIDVEGWEENVMMGGVRLFQINPPKAVVFEAQCDENTTILNKNIILLLENYGYKINWIQRASQKLHEFEGVFLENYLAVYTR